MNERDSRRAASAELRAIRAAAQARKHALIAKLLGGGLSRSAICERVGCGETMVRAVVARMDDRATRLDMALARGHHSP